MRITSVCHRDNAPGADPTVARLVYLPRTATQSLWPWPYQPTAFKTCRLDVRFFRLQQNQASRTGGAAAHLYPRHLATIRIRASTGCSVDQVIFTVP